MTFLLDLFKRPKQNTNKNDPNIKMHTNFTAGSCLQTEMVLTLYLIR